MLFFGLLAVVYLGTFGAVMLYEPPSFQATVWTLHFEYGSKVLCSILLLHGSNVHCKCFIGSTAEHERQVLFRACCADRFFNVYWQHLSTTADVSVAIAHLDA